MVPITEQSNEKSINIDLQSPENILKTLLECESEIFDGYNEYKGLFDVQLIDQTVALIEKIKLNIKKYGSTNIILIGAGTSGRLCRYIAKTFRTLDITKINIIPIIAGGTLALVRAQPNTEDSFDEGVQDFLRYTENLERSQFFVIGVSCGLSAKYVQGALDEANKYSNGHTAILGFNPKDLGKINLGDQITVLNPIVGPEPIVGSVRMKGGNTTLIVIYAILLSALDNSENSKESFIKFINAFKVYIDVIKGKTDQLKSVIEIIGNSLKDGSRLYTFSNKTLGPLCIFDAAECPPTFGANLTDVNGFTINGALDLSFYENDENLQFAKEIGVDYFMKSILPDISENDFVILIQYKNEDKEMFDEIEKHHKNSRRICLLEEDSILINNANININISKLSIYTVQLIIRSILVYISTGSFILAGKIFENKMIDLKITNKKLFDRAIRIVSSISKKDDETTQIALKKIIVEDISDNLQFEKLIEVASKRNNVIPLTILLLFYPDKSITELKAIISNQPIIRKLILNELKLHQ